MALAGLVVLAGGVGLPPWRLAGGATRPSKPDPVGTPIPCSTSVAQPPILATVETHFVSGLQMPFGVVFGPQSDHVFVDSMPSGFASNAANVVVEYTTTPSGLVRGRVGTVAGQSLIGLAASPNGRDLVAAGGSGATVLSLARMEQPKSPPSSWVRGSLSSGGQDAIEAAVSPDDSTAFVTLESSHEMAVFNLSRAEHSGFGPSDLVGYVPLGQLPVGIAISPNGHYLYVTSERASATQSEGTLTTIDLRRSERDPTHSIISTVWAGCDPVRVVASGDSVYVTARESDQVLEFSTAALASHPATALTAHVKVGAAPVGLALVDHDQRLVVGDSNRFGLGAGANLADVSTEGGASLALLGYVEAGRFPRDMAVSGDGKDVIVSNYGSGQVEDVVVSTLP
jgi:DNA-binding beta-propeller fold protein YncE